LTGSRKWPRTKVILPQACDSFWQQAKNPTRLTMSIIVAGQFVLLCGPRESLRLVQRALDADPFSKAALDLLGTFVRAAAH
jgi:hypothetical protein